MREQNQGLLSNIVESSLPNTAAKKGNVLLVQFIETEPREGKGCTLSNNRTFWKKEKLCRQLKNKPKNHSSCRALQGGRNDD